VTIPADSAPTNSGEGGGGRGLERSMRVIERDSDRRDESRLAIRSEAGQRQLA
jgi:hypothetical protein